MSFSLRFWLLAIEIAGLAFVVARWGELAGHLAAAGMLAEWILFLVGRKPRWAWIAPAGMLVSMIAAMEHAVPINISQGVAYVAILLAVAAEVVHLRSIWRAKPLPEGVTPLHRPAPPLRPVVREHTPHPTKPHGFVPAPPPVPVAPPPAPVPRDEDDLLALLFPELEAPLPPVAPMPTPMPTPVAADEDRWAIEDELMAAQAEPEPEPVPINEDEPAEEQESEPKVKHPRIKVPRIKPFSFAFLPKLPHRSRLSLVSVPMGNGTVVPVLAAKTNTVLICVGDRLAEWSDLGDVLMDMERAPGLALATIVAPAGETQTTWYLEISRPPSEALVLVRPLLSHLQIAPYSLVERAESATGARLDVADGGLIRVEDQHYSVAVAVAPLGGGTIDHVCAGAQRLATLGRDVILQGKLLDGISWALADITRPNTEQVEDIEVFVADRDNELLTRGLFVVSPPPGQAKELMKWSV